MSKHTNGIDYTPRIKSDKRKAESVVFNGIVRQQRAPFFEVHVAGHSVVFTDNRAEAHNALHTGYTLPRVLSMVDAYGARSLLEQVGA